AKRRHADVVDRQLTVLRQTPLSEADVARLRVRVDELRGRRERLDAGIDALAYVRANAEALAWGEAPRRLAADQALVPALEAQLREADAQQLAAGSAAEDAEKRH